MGPLSGFVAGSSSGRHVHRPSLDRWLALTEAAFGLVLVYHPFFWGFMEPLGGHHLVGSRRPEHRVEHAQESPGDRHDSPLVATAFPQPAEDRTPFRARVHQA